MKNLSFGFEIIGKQATLAMTKVKDDADELDKMHAAEDHIMALLPELAKSGQITINIFAIDKDHDTIWSECANVKKQRNERWFKLAAEAQQESD